MKLRSLALAATLAALTVAAGSARADVLRLKNGDILTGKVVSRDGGKVRFKSDLYGEVTVSEGDIASYKTGDNVTAADVQVAAAPAAAAAAGAAAGGSSNFTGQAGAPSQPVWTRSITVGGNYNSALFEQGQLAGAPPGTTGAAIKLPGRTYAVQTTASVTRATQSDIAGLDLTQTFSDSQPQGKIADNYGATFAWNHKISDRTYTVSRTSYSVDNVRNIDYSASQIFGFGFKVVDTPQTKFDLVPGVLLLQEKKGNRYDDEFIFGAGFLELFTYHFNPYASFEQRVLYRRGLKHSDIYLIDSYAGFKGMLSAQLGVTVGVTYNYDNTLGPLPQPFSAVLAQKKGVLQTTFGLQYKF